MRYIFLMGAGGLTGFVLGQMGFSTSDLEFWVVMAMEVMIALPLAYALFE